MYEPINCNYKFKKIKQKMLDFNIINLNFTIGIYFRLIHTEGIVFSIKGMCRAMLYQKRGSLNSL